MLVLAKSSGTRANRRVTETQFQPTFSTVFQLQSMSLRFTSATRSDTYDYVLLSSFSTSKDFETDVPSQ